jgi:hypothetical protein
MPSANTIADVEAKIVSEVRLRFRQLASISDEAALTGKTIIEIGWCNGGITGKEVTVKTTQLK